MNLIFLCHWYLGGQIAIYDCQPPKAACIHVANSQGYDGAWARYTNYLENKVYMVKACKRDPTPTEEREKE